MSKKKSDDDEYVVEKILDKRRSKEGQTQYLIKWEGYGTEDATWESEANANCSELIAEYESSLGKAKKKEECEEAEVDSILGITEYEGGERYFILRFKDSSAALVPLREANARFPQQVIKFYESHINLTSTS